MHALLHVGERMCVLVWAFAGVWGCEGCVNFCGGVDTQLCLKMQTWRPIESTEYPCLPPYSFESGSLSEPQARTVLAWAGSQLTPAALLSLLTPPPPQSRDIWLVMWVLRPEISAPDLGIAKQTLLTTEPCPQPHTSVS